MTPGDLRVRAASARERLPAERPPPEDRGKRLGTIARGDGEELRISFDTFEGRPFLSIRVWRNGFPDPKRGVSVRLRELPVFADAVAAALDEAARLPSGRQGGAP